MLKLCLRKSNNMQTEKNKGFKMLLFKTLGGKIFTRLIVIKKEIKYVRNAQE